VAAHHRSFLVTSVGAYADSGLGTGGFHCVHQGRSVVIDKIDSTACSRLVRRSTAFARGLQAILGYRRMARQMIKSRS
jgi:hypothetical protein